MNSAVRRCTTQGCASTVHGKERYCIMCRRVRRRRAQREYRKRPRDVDYLFPSEPPTSMAWLGKFKAWSSSGMSYADYQAAER